MTEIRVQKLDLSGAVTWQYRGLLLFRSARSVVLEAFFDKPDFPLLDVVLKQGDRFVETFYDDRLYNVFEIYDRDDARLKGWYCNLSRPARFTAEQVSWVDLALDLWAWPGGRTALLDEDEFAALPIGQAERVDVWNTVRQLERDFQKGRPPP